VGDNDWVERDRRWQSMIAIVNLSSRLIGRDGDKRFVRVVGCVRRDKV
jgi:hypothetical protein